MTPRSLEDARDQNTNRSAVSDPCQRTDDHSQAIADASALHQDIPEGLLATDLVQYLGDADKLYEISVNLQKLGTEQQVLIQKLKAEKISNLIPTPSQNSSRRQTNETDSSRATTMSNDSEETVLVFSPSDNLMTVRQRRSMKDTDYIKAELPPFHWWSDRLHIYFERRPSTDSSAHRQPHVVVVKDKIKEPSHRDVTLIRIVKLTQLGIGIRVRRMFGQIKSIYVLSPRPQSTHIQEMATYNVNDETQSLTKVKSVS